MVVVSPSSPSEAVFVVESLPLIALDKDDDCDDGGGGAVEIQRSEMGGRSGGAAAGGTGGFDTDKEELVEITLDADREGPSLAATNAERSTKDLNSYLAKGVIRQKKERAK